MNETIEFRGKEAIITVDNPKGPNDWVTATYPCGAQRQYGDMSIYKGWHNHRRHLDKCRACHVVLGLSKAKVLQTQQQTANLFGIGKDGFNANGVESKDGFLTYRGNIRAVRTTKGIIVNSQLDSINVGFGSVYPPKPTKNVIGELPLGTIRRMTNRGDFGWMKEIKVLDQNREEHWVRDSLISAIGYKLLITRDTNHRQYVIELPLLNGSETVADAVECLKPYIVKRHEKFGIKVVRQGEFYFIPVETLKDSDISDIIGVETHKEVEYRYNGYDKPKTPQVKTTLLFPSVDNQEDTHHRATKHGFYKGFNVVKGTVRHENRDHKMLKLPKNTWCVVAKNMQVSSLTVETGDAD